MIELKPVTKDNLEYVLELDVWEHQKSFVSSTACALAQAYVYGKTAYPFAIYADDTPVGFIMMGYYEQRSQYTLWKLLIDKNHQGKGYGREALIQGIQYLKSNFNAKEIYTGVAFGNSAAKALYLSVGFKETGLTENNAEELRYIV